MQLLSNKEKKAIESATETLSTHFMVTLPDLLSKVRVYSLVVGWVLYNKTGIYWLHEQLVH